MFSLAANNVLDWCVTLCAFDATIDLVAASQKYQRQYYEREKLFHIEVFLGWTNELNELPRSG